MDPQGPSEAQNVVDNGDDHRGRIIRVNVKFGGQSIPVQIAVNSTIRDLKAHLQAFTNVLTRGQKLIFKGKILSDDLTLASSGIIDGSKIMLMASSGIHQGDGPIRKEAVALPSARRGTNMARGKIENSDPSVKKNQHERWKATGVIALSDCGLTAIPEEVWTYGASARVLDVSLNPLHEVPAAIGNLRSIQKLILNGNHLLDKSIAWEGVTSLKSLVLLSLNLNNLTTLPPAIGALTCLKHLHIAGNKLMSLPTEIGLLTELQVLKLQNNRLHTVPTSIGGCVSLVEVDLSCNLLAELPETFGNLKDLKALYLCNNGLKSLPNTLLKMCLHLSILDLHGTNITNDVLRQFEGWESFDERRRLKHQKQLEFRVNSSAEFDEGADKNW